MTSILGIIAIMFDFGLLAKRVDIKTAFLYEDLKEEIYMECPQVFTVLEKMTASF